MMKKEINVFDYADRIVQQLQQGVLLISHAEGKTNAMTISWGALGIDFGEPVFTTYVRSGRFTHELIDKSGEFAVAVPLGDNPMAKKALGFCGSRTGREIDKLKEAGLTTGEPEVISTFGVKEMQLILECRVVYRQEKTTEGMDKDAFAKWYPQEVGSDCCWANRDLHVTYEGQIVKAYIQE